VTPLHVACRQASTFKLVIADDGGLVLVRWCAPCACALADEDCDPPRALAVEEIPPHLLAQLMLGADEYHAHTTRDLVDGMERAPTKGTVN
jgi:hypothetical protein